MNNTICFVDTCIISQALQEKAIMDNLQSFVLNKGYYLGITPHTISELHKSAKIFNDFLGSISIPHYFLIKPMRLIIQEECLSYPVGPRIDVSLTSPMMPIQEFMGLINDIVNIVDDEFPKGSKKEIIDSIVNLRTNFPPKSGNKYTVNEIDFFCKIVVSQKIKTSYKDYLSNSDIENLDYRAFKSLTAQALITFWRFYKTKGRKEKGSDVFDIAMSSCFPYFDIIFTENNIASDIRQIKRMGLGFEYIKEIYTINDLR